MADSVLATLSQSLIQTLTTFGVFICFFWVRIWDLALEGSYFLAGLGYITFALLGFPLWGSIILGAGLGLTAGASSAFLRSRLKMPDLVAGITVTIAARSCAVAFSGSTRPGPVLYRVLGFEKSFAFDPCFIVIFGLLTLVLCFLLTRIASMPLGLAMRAVGRNPALIRDLGSFGTRSHSAGFWLSHLLISLSGAIFACFEGRYIVSGFGRNVILGLTAALIGVLFCSLRYRETNSNKAIQFLFLMLLAGTVFQRLASLSASVVLSRMQVEGIVPGALAISSLDEGVWALLLVFAFLLSRKRSLDRALQL